MPDRSFGEISQNFNFIGRGKSKFLDNLYLIRQANKASNNRKKIKSLFFLRILLMKIGMFLQKNFVNDIAKIISEEKKLIMKIQKLIAVFKYFCLFF